MVCVDNWLTCSNSRDRLHSVNVSQNSVLSVFVSCMYGDVLMYTLLIDGALIILCSLQFLVKKEGFGGGGSRMLQFHQGQGDVSLLKPSGRTLHVTIGPGLPSSTSECL